MSEAREQLSDEWVESHDTSVDGYSGFPFEGCERDRTERADAAPDRGER
ncbi:MAG: hypothetical protein ABIK85_02010 [Candidatus Eisenbacteria bacterium]